MYSRYPNYRFSGGVRVPNNYSGNAFKEKEEQPPDTLTYNTTADAERAVTEIPEPPAEETADSSPVMKEKNTPSLLPFKFNFGKLLPNGFGSEELILLGLIILLSSSEKSDDILLFLILLLFI